MFPKTQVAELTLVQLSYRCRNGIKSHIATTTPFDSSLVSCHSLYYFLQIPKPMSFLCSLTPRRLRIRVSDQIGQYKQMLSQTIMYLYWIKLSTLDDAWSKTTKDKLFRPYVQFSIQFLISSTTKEATSQSRSPSLPMRPYRWEWERWERAKQEGNQSCSVRFLLTLHFNSQLILHPSFTCLEEIEKKLVETISSSSKKKSPRKKFPPKCITQKRLRREEDHGLYSYLAIYAPSISTSESKYCSLASTHYPTTYSGILQLLGRGGQIIVQ